jgi:LPS export ABC transporter protein LptC
MNYKMQRVHKIYFLLTAILFIMACAQSEEESVPDGNPVERPNQEGWNSEVVLTTDGVAQLVLNYQHMMRWDQKNMTTFNQGVRVDLFEKGLHCAWLTADSGDIRQNNLLAVGSVVVTSDSGISLRSKNLYWDDLKKRVRADGFVQITTQEDTLFGYEFESDRELNNWKLKRAFGQSSRDIDIRTGTFRSKKDEHQSKELDKEVERILKNDTK